MKSVANGPSAAETKEMRKREQEYQAEADLHTLIQAEKIKSDPERLKRVGAKLAAAKRELDNIKVG